MGAIAVGGWQSAVNPYVYSQTHIFDAGTRMFQSYSDYSIQHDGAVKAAAAGLYRHLIRKSGAYEQNFFVPSSTGREDAEAMANGVFATLVENARKERWASFSDAAPAWFGMTIIPPALLLGIGALLAWVLRGFAR